MYLEYMPHRLIRYTLRPLDHREHADALRCPENLATYRTIGRHLSSKENCYPKTNFLIDGAVDDTLGGNILRGHAPATPGYPVLLRTRLGWSYSRECAGSTLCAAGNRNLPVSFCQRPY